MAFRLFKPTWEDFVPEFTPSVLLERMRDMPYHLATMLYPPNMVSALEFREGEAGFVSFYSNAFDKQRKCLEEVIRNIPGLGENAIKAVGRVRAELLLPEESRKLVYWNGVTWFPGSNGTTPAFLAAYASHMLGLRPKMKALVIGFGYGYISAVFYEAMLRRGQVFGIDVNPALLKFVRKSWNRIGYKVNLRLKDGMDGWGEGQEFDAIWPSLTPRFLPDVWVKELKDGGRIAVFRAYTEDEYRYAFENIRDWSHDFPTFEAYQKEWWSELCLSVYRKEDGRLVEISNLYRIGNVPYVSPIHGVTRDREWQSLIGSNEAKLLEYFDRHVESEK